MNVTDRIEDDSVISPVRVLLDRVLERIRSDQLAAIEAVEKELSDNDLESEVRDYLVREGLLRLVMRQMSRDRGFPDRGDTDALTESEGRHGAPRSGQHQNQPSPADVSGRWYWLEKLHRTVDGPQKPLLDFTLEDAEAQFVFASEQLSAWTARTELWQATVTSLRKSHKARVGDMSETVLARLNDLAAHT